MTKSLPATRITSNGTTSIVTGSCLLSILVISVGVAGSSWVISVTDGSSPANVLVPAFTAILPADHKPIVIEFDPAIRMDGGVKVVTSGTTPGVVSVWSVFEQGSQ
jgi:hypothetical protein